MKRQIILFIALLILFTVFFVFRKPAISEESKVTTTATIVDRAMCDGLPYLGITLDDGSGLCLWDLEGDLIPNNIQIGDVITVTYARQEALDRFILLEVK